MKNIIFFAIVIFLFYRGITNFLEKKETGTPLEISFLNGNFGSFEDIVNPYVGTKILPKDQWRDILLGEWEYRYSEKPTSYYYFDGIFRGTVHFKEDSTFVRKFWFNGDIYDENDYNPSGKFFGEWRMMEDGNGWVEDIDPNRFSTNESDDTRDFNLLLYFSRKYGDKSEDDLWENEIIYFNENRIEIRVKYLGEKPIRTYRFTKIEQ